MHKVLKSHRHEVDQVISQVGVDKLLVGHLCTIICGNMYIDKFQDLLNESMNEDDGISRTYLQVQNHMFAG